MEYHELNRFDQSGLILPNASTAYVYYIYVRNIHDEIKQLYRHCASSKELIE